MKKIIKSMLSPLSRFVSRKIENEFNKYFHAHILPNIEGMRFNDQRNIEGQLQLDALRSTTRYVARKMGQAKGVSNKEDVLNFALENVTISEGLYCEFGVYQGYTINHIAKKINTSIHGFDSFEGLPEFWRDGFDKETFKVDSLANLNFENNVFIHGGLFEETLPNFVESYNGPIAFLHVDCDLYSSTKCIFNYIGDRLVPGSVIVFDEYFNYPSWQQHEFKAFKEFVASSNIKYQYLGYNKYDEQVIILVI